MARVIAAPHILKAAASDLAAIGSTINSANSAAVAPTSGLAPAGADGVSAVIAAMFSEHAQTYQALSAQATEVHQQFVQVLNAGAGSYATAEHANASTLDQVRSVVNNAPARLGANGGVGLASPLAGEVGGALGVAGKGSGGGGAGVAVTSSNGLAASNSGGATVATNGGGGGGGGAANSGGGGAVGPSGGGGSGGRNDWGVPAGIGGLSGAGGFGDISAGAPGNGGALLPSIATPGWAPSAEAVSPLQQLQGITKGGASWLGLGGDGHVDTTGALYGGSGWGGGVGSAGDATTFGGGAGTAGNGNFGAGNGNLSPSGARSISVPASGSYSPLAGNGSANIASNLGGPGAVTNGGGEVGPASGGGSSGASGHGDGAVVSLRANGSSLMGADASFRPGETGWAGGNGAVAVTAGASVPAAHHEQAAQAAQVALALTNLKGLGRDVRSWLKNRSRDVEESTVPSDDESSRPDPREELLRALGLRPSEYL